MQERVSIKAMPQGSLSKGNMESSMGHCNQTDINLRWHCKGLDRGETGYTKTSHKVTLPTVKQSHTLAHTLHSSHLSGQFVFILNLYIGCSIVLRDVEIVLRARQCTHWHTWVIHLPAAHDTTWCQGNAISQTADNEQYNRSTHHWGFSYLLWIFISLWVHPLDLGLHC